MYRLVGVALALLTAGCFQVTAPPAPEPAGYAPGTPLPPIVERRDLTAAERALLALAFARDLKDPESARFTWTRVPKVLPADGLVDYCATVNAKNSYGGYVGATAFRATLTVRAGKIVGGTLEDMNRQEFPLEDRAGRACRARGLEPA